MRYQQHTGKIVDRGGSIKHINELDKEHRFFVDEFSSRTPFKIYSTKLLYTSTPAGDRHVACTRGATKMSKRVNLGSGERNYFVMRDNTELSIKFLEKADDLDKVVQVKYIVDTKSKRKIKRVEEPQAPVEQVDISEVYSNDIKEIKAIRESIEASVLNSTFMKMDVGAKYDLYKSKHALFANRHPIVLRYIVQLSEPGFINFDMGAFRKYLKKTSERRPYAECGEHYVCELFKAINPKYKMSQLRDVRSGIARILEEESKLMGEADEEGGKEEKHLDANVSNSHRHEVAEFVAKHGVVRYEDDAPAVPSDSEEVIGDFDLDYSSQYM